MKSLSRVWLFATPWTVAYQVSPSMGFSRQEYWSGLPFPSSGQPRQHIKKHRHYFANKCLSSQSYGFSSSQVWIWELDYKESWAQKNWCFWTVVCWRRLLRIPWTARRSNQSILRKVSPEYSLAGLILKLKLQYFGHLMWRIDSLKIPWCWERLKTRGEGDNRGWDGWMASLTG